MSNFCENNDIIVASPYLYQGQVYSPAFSDASDSPPESPMSTANDSDEETVLSQQHDDEEEPVSHQPFTNPRPRWPTKYHKELSTPLYPVTTLLPPQMLPQNSIVASHNPHVDAHLQEQLCRMLNLDNCGNNSSDLEAFLRLHSEHVDLNTFGKVSGCTPLHEACLRGDLDRVRVLLKFGANPRLTNRDGFSVIHLATFSGNSDLLRLVISSNKSPKVKS